MSVVEIKNGSIRLLPPEVVNRIAAGEVIQRPASIAKEMIENSLDAGATQITLTLGGGGLKYLQIQDDGAGISKSDLELLCQRFTTSKLRCYEDLQSLTSYGFRGEALASVSLVSHLTVTTKRKEEVCAHKATFKDGFLIDFPKPCAGNVGTLFTIEDVFYNMPVRREALKSVNEEYSRVVDVVSRYAVHNTHCGFTVRKQGESGVDIRTTPGADVKTVISALYGSRIVENYQDFSLDDAGCLGFSVTGGMTTAMYTIGKRFIFLLFINHRLVQSTALKKGLEAVYVNHLPKGAHPFVYLSIQIRPDQIDVNVHPTKQEVHFLYESEIIEKIGNLIEAKLVKCTQSKIFQVESLSEMTMKATWLDAGMQKVRNSDPDAKRRDHQLIRTDCREQKLDSFFRNEDKNRNSLSQSFGGKFGNETVACTGSPCSSTATDDILLELYPEISIGTHRDKTGCKDITTARNSSTTHGFEEASRSCMDKNNRPSTSAALTNDEVSLDAKPESVEQINWRPVKLTSVIQLQQEVLTRCDGTGSLGRKLMRGHSLVGLVNPRLALLQYETCLYVVNTEKLSEELMYQTLLYRFGNFGVLRLSEPAPIKELCLIALESGQTGWSPADGTVESVAERCRNILANHSAMLWDYFSIEIRDGMLVSIPEVLTSYTPQLDGLPELVLRLANKCDWTSEKTCFHSICRQTASFYAVHSCYCDGDNWSKLLSPASPESSVAATNNPVVWKDMMTDVLFPVMKQRLLPPVEWLKDTTILKLADLFDLYKVFERC